MMKLKNSSVLTLLMLLMSAMDLVAHPLVVLDGLSTTVAVQAVNVPLRLLPDHRLMVAAGDAIDGAPTFEQVCDFYADKPDVRLFCEFKPIEPADEGDVTGFRQAYVRAFGETVRKIRPDFANVVCFTVDGGLVDELRRLYPDCPFGLISRYRGGAANDYRLDKWKRNGQWLRLDFKDTPVQTVRRLKDNGLNVLLAPIADEIEYRQADLMGADAVLTTNGALSALNVTPPKARTDEIPPGARRYGYTKCVVDERNITPDDIKFDFTDKSPSKWYNGQWFGKQKPPRGCYTNRWGFLEMESDCVMMSTPPQFGARGLLPVLHGKDGFYIEFTVSLSDFHPSHACSLWMFPTDKLPGGGPVPWFMELDVDEAKFGMGLSGSLHSMGEGNPLHLSNYNNVRLPELDRTKPITFGAAFDPKTQQVTWWHSNQKNGELVMSADSPFVPKIAKELDYFWLITCRGPQGKLKDTQPKYRKFVYNVRAFVPESSPIPAVGAKAVVEAAKPSPRWTGKQTWMQGKPNGALAYGYTNEVLVVSNACAAALEKLGALSGRRGFYVEATYAPGAKGDAAVDISGVSRRRERLSVTSRITAFGFEGLVRHSDARGEHVNANAKRYCVEDSDKPLTLGISYDPENNHIVFWRNNQYVFQVRPPDVPSSAAADDYALAVGGVPISVKVYSGSPAASAE